MGDEEGRRLLAPFFCVRRGMEVSGLTRLFWLTPDLFRLRRVTWKSRNAAPPPSNQGVLLLVRVLLRQTSLHSGPAPWAGVNGPSMAHTPLAASMRLDPLHETCVRPAPKPRLAVSVPLRIKIKTNQKPDTGPVAFRLAGGGALEVAAAGKPNCYRKVWGSKTQISETPQIATLGGRA